MPREAVKKPPEEIIKGIQKEGYSEVRDSSARIRIPFIFGDEIPVISVCVLNNKGVLHKGLIKKRYVGEVRDSSMGVWKLDVILESGKVETFRLEDETLRFFIKFPAEMKDVSASSWSWDEKITPENLEKKPKETFIQKIKAVQNIHARSGWMPM